VNPTGNQLDRGIAPQCQDNQYPLSIPIEEVIKNITNTMDLNKLLAIGSYDSTEEICKLTHILLFDEL
jgi:hypothetical protein